MRSWFHRSAAIALLKRRKGPVGRMILVSFAGCLWFFAGGSWIVGTWRDMDRQAAEISIDVFLQQDVSDSSATSLAASIKMMPNVHSGKYVSESSVWSEFSADVGIDDELHAIVRMPSIVRFSLVSDAVHENDVSVVARAIERAYPETVSEVVWPQKLVRMLDERRRDVMLLGIAAAALSFVLFIFALAYAFRAEIHRAGADLYVGIVLGVQPSSIAMPHLIVSLVSGSLGLFTAFGAICIVGMYVTELLHWMKLVELKDLGLMAAMLAVIGAVVCWQQSVSAAFRAEKKGQ